MDIPGVVATWVHLQTGETAVTIADNKIGPDVLLKQFKRLVIIQVK